MNEAPKLSESEYLEYVELLLNLVVLQPRNSHHKFENEYFLHLQGLISAVLECGISAKELVVEKRYFAANIVLRSILEHLILALYLFKSKTGVQESEYLRKKSVHDLVNMAIKANAQTANNDMLEKNGHIRIQDFEFLKSTPQIIKKFKQETVLMDFYFLFSQNAHPLSASYMYSDYDEANKIPIIKRVSNHSDPMTLLPHVFRFAALALILDSELRADEKLHKIVSAMIEKEGFNPNLELLVY